MLVLVTTTDTLRVITSAAVTVDVVASHIDCTQASPPVVSQPETTVTAITTATTTTVVAAPGGTLRRNVKALHIRNKHATTACDITVTLERSATVYELHKVTLRAGESLEYVEGVGFFTLQASAAELTRNLLLASDQSNSTTTPTEITGLSVVTGTGIFAFKYLIRYQSSITTTGVKFSVNHAGTVSFFVANTYFADLVGTASSATPDQDSVLAAATVFGVFAARAKSTAGVGVTLSVDTANADMLTIIEGIVGVTADGELELWHGSETAAATTVKAGSVLLLNKCL